MTNILRFFVGLTILLVFLEMHEANSKRDDIRQHLSNIEDNTKAANEIMQTTCEHKE